MIINGCAAHTVNLLVKDICQMDDNAEIMMPARDITSFVNDRNISSKGLERVTDS